MIIRRAKQCDSVEIYGLLRQVLDLHHELRPDLFRGGAAKYTEEQFYSMLKDESRPIFVAEDEKGRIVGYAFCAFIRHERDNILTDIKTLYIDDLCVDETCRGRGIGRRLCEHVMDFADSEGCYNVTLNVWADNADALGFYESLGLHKQKIGMEKIL